MRLIVTSTLKLIAYAATLIFGSIRPSLCQQTVSTTMPRDVRTPNVAVRQRSVAIVQFPGGHIAEIRAQRR
jgi:hypothetical protein